MSRSDRAREHLERYELGRQRFRRIEALNHSALSWWTNPEHQPVWFRRTWMLLLPIGIPIYLLGGFVIMIVWACNAFAWAVYDMWNAPKENR